MLQYCDEGRPECLQLLSACYGATAPADTIICVILRGIATVNDRRHAASEVFVDVVITLLLCSTDLDLRTQLLSAVMRFRSSMAAGDMYRTQTCCGGEKGRQEGARGTWGGEGGVGVKRGAYLGSLASKSLCCLLLQLPNEQA